MIDDEIDGPRMSFFGRIKDLTRRQRLVRSMEPKRIKFDDTLIRDAIREYVKDQGFKFLDAHFYFGGVGSPYIMVDVLDLGDQKPKEVAS